MRVDRERQARTARRSTLLLARSMRPEIASGTILVLVALSPLVVSEYLVSDVLSRALILALLALALDLSWGYTGILSLGQSAFFGIGAYAVAILTMSWDSAWAALTGLALALTLPLLLAAVVGWFVFLGASSGLYVAIVTLALPVLLSAIDLRIPNLTGGLTGLSGVPSFPWDSDLTTFYVLLATVAAATGASHWLVRSDLGRLLVAVRDNEVRARFLGYPTPKIKLGVFMLAAALSGLAGAIYAPYSGFVSYDLLGLTLSTNAIVWVAVGGRGTLTGPLLGALVINVLEPGLNHVFPGFWQLVLGLVFIVVILLFPAGLYGVLAGRRPQSAALRIAETAPRPATSSTKTLSVSGLHLSFGSLAVLQGVDLSIATGTLHCLVGPNGAGKSTLVNVITGFVRPTAGQISIDGIPVMPGLPELMARRLVLRTFQASNVFETLTVGDNLLLARAGRRMPSSFSRTEVATLPPEVIRVLVVSGLDKRLGDRAGELGHGERKWLELCMVLAAEPAIVFLDEPTAGLSVADRATAGDVLTDLVRKEGLGLLLIEHDLDFVKSIAERLTVLSNGKLIADGSVRDVISNPKVQQIYLGTASDLKAEDG